VLLESKLGVCRDARVELAGDGALDDVERPHSPFHLVQLLLQAVHIRR
jgi:hypothetical protein